jgi:hypothetical protein
LAIVSAAVFCSARTAAPGMVEDAHAPSMSVAVRAAAMPMWLRARDGIEIRSFGCMTVVPLSPVGGGEVDRQFLVQPSIKV